MAAVMASRSLGGLRLVLAGAMTLGVGLVAQAIGGVQSAGANTWPRTIPLGVFSQPHGIASDGTHVWVATCGPTTSPGGAISELDASAGALIQNLSDYCPSGIWSDGTHVWATSYGDNQVTDLNASTGSLVQQFIGPTIRVAGFPSDGTQVWVSAGPNDGVVERNASDGAARPEHPSGP